MGINAVQTEPSISTGARAAPLAPATPPPSTRAPASRSSPPSVRAQLPVAPGAAAEVLEARRWPHPVARHSLARRARVARALDSIGLLDRLLALRNRLAPPALTVLTYHRVLGEDDGLDCGVIEADPSTFERQLEVVRAHCAVVSLRDVRRFAAGAPMPRNAALIAFDDGYRDNYDVALPILKKHALPATFFIATAYPEAGRLFWWDKIAWLVRNARRPLVALRYPTTLVVRPQSEPERAISALSRIVKSTPGLDLARFFETLEAAFGVALSAAAERELARRTIMSWSDIRALRREGMDVQSHSHSHRVLQTLPVEEARLDLATSRHILTEVLGEPVDSVAYPVGYSLDERLRTAAHDAGFTLGFTNSSGFCQPTRRDPLDLPRLAVDAQHGSALFKALLLLGDTQAHGPGRASAALAGAPSRRDLVARKGQR